MSNATIQTAPDQVKVDVRSWWFCHDPNGPLGPVGALAVSGEVRVQFLTDDWNVLTLQYDQGPPRVMSELVSSDQLKHRVECLVGYSILL